MIFVNWKTIAVPRWEQAVIQHTSARHSLLALITASVILALFLIQNYFPEMLYFLAGDASGNPKVNSSIREKPEVKRTQGLVALENNMASVSLQNVEMKMKEYGHNCCAAAKCSNGKIANFKCEEETFIARLLIKNFVAQRISVPSTLKLVLQALGGR